MHKGEDAMSLLLPEINTGSNMVPHTLPPHSLYHAMDWRGHQVRSEAVDRRVGWCCALHQSERYRLEHSKPSPGVLTTQ